MAEHQVLFCPFCGESFEHQTRCPEHELSLVAFDQLPINSALIDDEPEADELALRALPSDDRPLALLEPQHGRGLVALGALLNLSALALPLSGAEGTGSVAAYRLARAIPSLGTLALVSFTVLYALGRRRTLRRLRGLRVLVPLLALLSPLSLGWASLRLGASRPGGAVYAVAVASLLLLTGGLRLGGARGGAALARASRELDAPDQ